jgi:hypothetical protein
LTVDSVDGLATLADRLRGAGHAVVWDESIAEVSRFYTHDPFGNRVELLSATVCDGRHTAGA